jgi:hypothetical protein
MMAKLSSVEGHQRPDRRTRQRRAHGQEHQGGRIDHQEQAQRLHEGGRQAQRSGEQAGVEGEGRPHQPAGRGVEADDGAQEIRTDGSHGKLLGLA